MSELQIFDTKIVLIALVEGLTVMGNVCADVIRMISCLCCLPCMCM